MVASPPEGSPMRLTSLLVLLAIVGGGIYVVFFTDWLKKGEDILKGYHDAKSPQEAMDLFRKAIQARQYETAAKYCTGAYAEQLKRAHTAAREMGTTIDQLYAQMEKKGFNSDKAVSALNKLDAFPTWFKVKLTLKQNEDKATGRYGVEDKTQITENLSRDAA